METNENQSLEISKDFNVSRNELYKAWIDPEKLKQWWKPMHNHLVEVENDVTPNGKIKYTFKSDDNEDSFTVSGEYLDVKDQERLEYTWNWRSEHKELDNGDFKLTIEFLENGDTSTLKVKQDKFSSEESIKPHQEGWEKAMKDFESFLAGSGHSNADQATGSGHDSHPIESNSNNTASANNVTGYNELPEQEKVGGYSL